MVVVSLADVVGDGAAQMDGPGLHYIRRSYRKQAAQVARGNHSGLNRSDGGGASQVRASCGKMALALWCMQFTSKLSRGRLDKVCLLACHT